MDFSSSEDCREFLENLKPPLTPDQKIDLMMATVGFILLEMSRKDESQKVGAVYKVLGEHLQKESGLL